MAKSVSTRRRRCEPPDDVPRQLARLLSNAVDRAVALGPRHPEIPASDLLARTYVLEVGRWLGRHTDPNAAMLS